MSPELMLSSLATTLCVASSSFVKTTFWPAFTDAEAGSNAKLFMWIVTADAAAAEASEL